MLATVVARLLAWRAQHPPLGKRSGKEMAKTHHVLGALAVAAAGVLAAVGMLMLTILVVGEPAEAAFPGQSNEAHKKELLLDKDPQGNPYVAGELLVSYKQGAFKKVKDAALKKVGGKVERYFPQIGAQHISLAQVKNEQSQAARQAALQQMKKALEQDPDVKSVSYNYVREGSWVPNDTHYGDQWALPNIKAPGAWDIERGSRDIKIAILDSGIDNSHPDIYDTRKVAGQKDFVNNDNDASDDQGHGTIVAGIVAANTNNARGVAGVCPNCSLLIGKVLDMGNKAQDANVIAGVNWAVGQRAKVINLSLALGGQDPVLQAAIHRAWTQGAVVVAATGNDGSDTKTVYPAAYPDVIAVAATGGGAVSVSPTFRDSRAIYKWEPGDYCYLRTPQGTCSKSVAASNAGDWVDVAAPGKDIYTPVRCTGVPSCGEYTYRNDAWGTSMAAPHVSGVAGLIFSKGGHEGHPANWSPAEVRSRIESTARDLGKPGKDPVYGHGAINAQSAVGGARCPEPKPTIC
jgi:subtilisin family serine protease